jgi:polar amino acid transport system substrate-binding protein
MRHGSVNGARRIALGATLVALIVGRAVTAASTPNCEPTLAELSSGERPLVVGGVSDFGPFNSVANDGRLTGMDRDIIRAAGERLGIKKIEFKVMPFSRLGQSLLDGMIDLIANNYWITPDRERL